MCNAKEIETIANAKQTQSTALNAFDPPLPGFMVPADPGPAPT